ncbi:MAG: winged helix-turn-helix transcriptional regulator [Candidatus Cryptobacteroides sp.]
MSITLDELAVSLGKSRSTIKRIVDALKTKGVLDREGARKNGRWVLK